MSGHASADLSVGGIRCKSGGIPDSGGVNAFELPEFRSAPQKHPMPNMASWTPVGNGGCRRLPLTKCAAGTGIASGRPGSA